MGLTAGCAKCHSHKYDPISQKEYYRLFAIFNQTLDADRVDDAPVLRLETPAQREAIAALKSEIERARSERGQHEATETSAGSAAQEADEKVAGLDQQLEKLEAEVTKVPYMAELPPDGERNRLATVRPFRTRALPALPAQPGKRSVLRCRRGKA